MGKRIMMSSGVRVKVIAFVVIVRGVGFMIKGLGFRVKGCRVYNVVCRVYASGCRGVRFRV